MNKKYLSDLLNSQKFVFNDGSKDDISFWRKKEEFYFSGLYILHPKFKIDNNSEIYLKIGKTTSRYWKRIKQKQTVGLCQRIGTHFKNQEKSTVLGRHIMEDESFSKRFNLDFSDRNNRMKFLSENTYFQILPLPEFNCNSESDVRKRNREILDIESFIENELRNKIRYIGSVVSR